MFKYKYVWPYALVGLTFIILLTVNGIYLYRHLSVNKTYASIINQAGRQRMLSQRMALLAYEKRAGKSVNAELADDIVRFDNQHMALQQLQGEIFTPRIATAFKALNPIQEKLSRYYIQVYNTIPDEAMLNNIGNEASFFLVKMDAIVNGFELNAKTDLLEISETQKKLGYASAFLMFLVIGVFIYSYHRKILKAYRDLKVAKAEIEKLHTGAVLSIEGIQAGVWDWNISTNVQVWSPKFYELLGYKTGEIESSRSVFLNELLHAEDKERVMQGIEAHIQHNVPYSLEVRILHKDGKYRWFEVAGKAKRDADGQPVRIGGSIVDITENINYRRQLEYDEFLLQEAGGMAKVGGWELDVLTQEMVWTRTMFDIHETFPGDTKRLYNRLNNYPAEYHALINESLHRALNHGEPFDIEVMMITTKGNKKWIRSIGKPVYDDNQQVVKLRGVYQDINQAKLRELEMDTLKHELQVANNAKDKIFSIIAHDLRSPLNSLQSLMSLKEDDLINETEFKGYLQKLKMVSGSISFTMENLLQWSVTQMQGFKVNPVRVNISTSVNEALGLYNESVRRKAIIINNSCKPMHYVNADTDHVNLVVRNIISNAVKFTPYGGSIDIESDIKNGFAELCISDTGVGMDATDIEKINNAKDLYSTPGTEGEKGLGLGLNFCKDMAALNDGSIAVASQKGYGTQIKLILPVSMLVDNTGALKPDVKEKSQAV